MKILTVTIIAIILGASAGGETALSLSEAIELSLEHSYGIKSSRHDSAAAEGDYKAAGALRFPTLSLNATTFYIDEVQSAELPFGQSIEIGVNDNYQADLRLSVPLLTGGRISNRIKISQQNVLAKSLGLEAEQLKTAFECRTAYLILMLTQALASSAEASLERIKIVRRDVENLHSEGLADSVDILDAESAYQKALLMYAEKKSAKKNAESALSRLLGLSGGEPILPTETIPFPEEKQRHVGITSEKINRAELKMFDSRIRSADYMIRINKTDYFPNINGFVGYSIGRPNRDFLDNEWNDNFIAGFTADWRLSLGGKTQHRIRSAEESAFSARMSRKNLEESLVLTADIALENLTLAYRTFATSQREHEIAKQKYRLGKEKQKAGFLTVNRLLEMEAELTSSEELFRASMINYHISETRFLYATGSPRVYGGL